MDPMDSSAAPSAGDNKQHLIKKGRHGLRQLHLRRAAVQPQPMQSENKCGPKKIIAEEWQQSKVRPSSKKTSQEEEESQQRTADSEKTLKFLCCQCGDTVEYVPKDLVRHFEDKHKGSPPVFSCHTCTFKTHEFSHFEIHLLSHKDTYSSCSICNDNVQRTWPEFSAHLTANHCQNGKYICDTCQSFSTGDVRVFLEHICAHNLGLEGANEDFSLLTKGKNQLGSKITTLRCQHCGYEASQKWLITKHIKAAHVCQNINQRRRKELHSRTAKPNDPIQNMKPRLTRSAVKEMCWLTQDCLSLPGREFLDKYCHLSDPQTTLEETQQFLMKSVVGETGDQKWTKALKTVFSNVPQDVNLHPKSENGILSNSSDLTVLTVKNKITVAQNGETYAKRLRRTTRSDKDVFPDSAADGSRCVVDQSECQSNLIDCLPPQTETKLLNEVSVLSQSEVSECTQMQENRENRELSNDQELEENGKKHQDPIHNDVANISSEIKLTCETGEQSSIRKVPPKNKRQSWRRKRKAKLKKVEKETSELPLKIVLKKNPVKEKQWVSQSSLSASEADPSDLMDEGLSTLHTSMETTAQVLTEDNRSTASRTDVCEPSEGVVSDPQLMPGEDVSDAQPMETYNLDLNQVGTLESSLTTDEKMRDETEMSMQVNERRGDGDEISSAARTGDVAEMFPEKVEQESSKDVDCLELDNKRSSAADGDAQSCCTNSSSFSQPVITPHEQNEHRPEGRRNGEVPADSGPDYLSTPWPLEKAIQQEPSSASGCRWEPVSKYQERTLKLVAINPSQLVKRPAGDQPVVVLNHPDADIPEVARIMEVVNRYRGEVQRVVLSRRTLRALSTVSSEAPEVNDPSEVLPDSAEPVINSVRERFLLKLKLRRLSRKKYEVVDVVSPSKEKKFRCWFCGRAFASQDVWMDHRQRHLMEWKGPNCENS